MSYSEGLIVLLSSRPGSAGPGRSGESLPSIEDVVTVASPAGLVVPVSFLSSVGKNSRVWVQNGPNKDKEAFDLLS